MNISWLDLIGLYIRYIYIYILDSFLHLHIVYHVSQQGYDLPPVLTTAGFPQVLGGSFIASGSQDCTADGKTKI